MFIVDDIVRFVPSYEHTGTIPGHFRVLIAGEILLIMDAMGYAHQIPSKYLERVAAPALAHVCTMEEYIGLTNRFHYCTICDKKER